MLSVFGEPGAVHVLGCIHKEDCEFDCSSAKTQWEEENIMIPGFMPFYVLFLRKIPSDKGDSVLASAFQSLYLINSTILIRLHALFSSSNCWPTCSLAGVDCSCLWHYLSLSNVILFVLVYLAMSLLNSFMTASYFMMFLTLSYKLNALLII